MPMRWLALGLALSLALGAHASCQGNACPEQRQAAQAAGLLGSPANCADKKYPAVGTVPAVSAPARRAPPRLPAQAPSAGAPDQRPRPGLPNLSRTLPRAPLHRARRVQVSIEQRIVDLRWAAAADGTPDGQVPAVGGSLLGGAAAAPPVRAAAA